MRCVKVIHFSCLLVIILIASILSSGRGYAASPRSCGSWNIVPNPNPGLLDALNGVVAVAPNSVWTVGNYLASNGHGQTLIEHWDGTSWSIVPSPNPGLLDNGLYGIAQIPGTADLWAVGRLKNTTISNDYQALIENWNGTAWQNVPSPSLNGGNNVLSAITATSPDDAWAVGSFVPDNGGHLIQDVIEHWNGVQWSIVPSPNPGTSSNYLNGIAAVSATNVWAVGEDTNIPDQYSTSMTLHWDGTTWSVVSSPNPGADGGTLFGVTPIPGTQQLWATGTFYNSHYTGRTFTEKWNGTTWRVVSSPNPPRSSNTLYAISALSSHDAWAVGSQQLVNSPSQNLILHWDGTAWTIVPAPKVGTDYNLLNSVAQIAGTTQAWTVGVQFSGTGSEGAFTASYC
jgi:hypothetical protein